MRLKLQRFSTLGLNLMSLSKIETAQCVHYILIACHPLSGSYTPSDCFEIAAQACTMYNIVYILTAGDKHGMGAAISPKIIATKLSLSSSSSILFPFSFFSFFLLFILPHILFIIEVKTPFMPSILDLLGAQIFLPYAFSPSILCGKKEIGRGTYVFMCGRKQKTFSWGGGATLVFPQFFYLLELKIP